MLSLKVKQIAKQLKKQTAELNRLFREDLQRAQLGPIPQIGKIFI